MLDKPIYELQISSVFFVFSISDQIIPKYNPTFIPIFDSQEHIQAYKDDVLVIVSGGTGGLVENRMIYNKLILADSYDTDHARNAEARIYSTGAPKEQYCRRVSQHHKSTRVNDKPRSCLTVWLALGGVTKRTIGHKIIATAARAHWGLDTEKVRSIYLAVVEYRLVCG